MEQSHHVTFGMNRKKQTPLLMPMALVINMALVLVWSSGVVLTPMQANITGNLRTHFHLSKRTY